MCVCLCVCMCVCLNQQKEKTKLMNLLLYMITHMSFRFTVGTQFYVAYCVL